MKRISYYSLIGIFIFQIPFAVQAMDLQKSNHDDAIVPLRDTLDDMPIEAFKKRMKSALGSPSIHEIHEQNLKKYSFDLQERLKKDSFTIARNEFLNCQKLFPLKQKAIEVPNHEHILGYFQALFLQEHNELQKINEVSIARQNEERLSVVANNRYAPEREVTEESSERELTEEERKDLHELATEKMIQKRSRLFQAQMQEESDSLHIVKEEELDSFCEFAPAMIQWEPSKLRPFIKGTYFESLKSKIIEYADQEAFEYALEILAKASQGLQTQEKKVLEKSALSLFKRFSRLWVSEDSGDANNDSKHIREFLVTYYKKYPFLIMIDRQLTKKAQQVLKNSNNQKNAASENLSLFKNVQFSVKKPLKGVSLDDEFFEHRQKICHTLLAKKEYDAAADDLVSILLGKDKQSLQSNKELNAFKQLAEKSQACSIFYALSTFADNDDQAAKEFIKAEHCKSSTQSFYKGYAFEQAISRMQQRAAMGDKAANAALATHYFYEYKKHENEPDYLDKAYNHSRVAVPSTTSNVSPCNGIAPAIIEHAWGTYARQKPGQLQYAKEWFRRGSQRGDTDCTYNLITIMLCESEDNQVSLRAPLELLQSQIQKNTKDTERFVKKLKEINDQIRYNWYLLPSDRRLLVTILNELPDQAKKIVFSKESPDEYAQSTNPYLQCVRLFEQGLLRESLELAQKEYDGDGMCRLWLRDLLLEGIGCDVSYDAAFTITKALIDSAAQCRTIIEPFIQRGLRSLVCDEYAPAVYYCLSNLFDQKGNKSVLFFKDALTLGKSIESKLALMDENHKNLLYEYKIPEKICSDARNFLEYEDEHMSADGWDLFGFILGVCTQRIAYEGLKSDFPKEKLDQLLLPFIQLNHMFQKSATLDRSKISQALGKLPLTLVAHLIKTSAFLERVSQEKSLEILCTFLKPLTIKYSPLISKDSDENTKETTTQNQNYNLVTYAYQEYLTSYMQIRLGEQIKNINYMEIVPHLARAQKALNTLTDLHNHETTQVIVMLHLIEKTIIKISEITDKHSYAQLKELVSSHLQAFKTIIEKIPHYQNCDQRAIEHIEQEMLKGMIADALHNHK